MVTVAREEGAMVIVISMVAPGSALAGVSLCRRLRTAMPEAFIVAGAWIEDSSDSAQGNARLRTRLERAGANAFCPTLERTVATLTTLAA
jgi:hypothetical protein